MGYGAVTEATRLDKIDLFTVVIKLLIFFFFRF